MLLQHVHGQVCVCVFLRQILYKNFFTHGLVCDILNNPFTFYQSGLDLKPPCVRSAVCFKDFVFTFLL